MDWAQIIVVLLAICLILFVVVAAVLLIVILRLTLQIKSLVRSAHTAAENVTQAFTEAGALTKGIDLLNGLRRKVKKYRKKEKRDE
jgi:predicted Holliday junction resolvase-like endonuclease